MRLRLHPLHHRPHGAVPLHTSGGRTSRSTVAALTLALVAAVGLTACSGDDTEGSSSAPTSAADDSASTAEAQSIDKANAKLTARVVEIGPGVKKKAQTHIRRQLARPIESWMDSAYLAGDFPHQGYTKKDFHGWTAQAATLAARDKKTTSSDFVRQKAVQVVADRRDARLFVFTMNGVAGGATANIYLIMTATMKSGAEKKYAVAGQVYLTRKGNDWRIFGYDLHRTELRR